jgi:competence protein ComEA
VDEQLVERLRAQLVGAKPAKPPADATDRQPLRPHRKPDRRAANRVAPGAGKLDRLRWWWNEHLDMKERVLLAAIVVIGVVALAAVRLRPAAQLTTESVPAPTSHPASEASEASRGASSASPPSSSASPEATVRVHVAGAVAAPGVYTLPAGSRAEDAVQAAGGPVPGADVHRVNLAAAVVDGTQLYLPMPGEALPQPGAGVAAGGAAAPAGGPINLNTATIEQLDTLPGIGEVTARKIIAYRSAHGPFESVESLLDVPGIGEAKLAAIADFVTV